MSDRITRRQALRSAGVAGLGIGAFGGIDGLLSAAAEAARPGRHGPAARLKRHELLSSRDRRP